MFHYEPPFLSRHYRLPGNGRSLLVALFTSEVKSGIGGAFSSCSRPADAMIASLGGSFLRPPDATPNCENRIAEISSLQLLTGDANRKWAKHHCENNGTLPQVIRLKLLSGAILALESNN